jgi:hypothetical protein
MQKVASFKTKGGDVYIRCYNKGLSYTIIRNIRLDGSVYKSEVVKGDDLYFSMMRLLGRQEFGYLKKVSPVP